MGNKVLSRVMLPVKTPQGPLAAIMVAVPSPGLKGSIVGMTDGMVKTL